MSEQIRKWLPLISIYGIVLAVAYHGTYWSSFGINVLAYATVTDVAKMSVIPLASSVAIFLVPQFLIGLARQAKSPWGRALGLVLIIVGLVTAGIVITLLITLLAAIGRKVFTRELTSDGQDTHEFGEYPLNFDAFWISAYAAMIILFAMLWASRDAERLVHGTSNTSVVIGEDKYTYIGFIDGNAFLLDGADSMVRIQPLANVNALELVVHPPISERFELPYKLWPRWWSSLMENGAERETKKDNSISEPKEAEDRRD